MSQPVQCPICGKEGIPDFHKEDVVCPCCGSDLSIYNRLREVTEINTTSSHCGLRNKWFWSVTAGVLIVALIAFCITHYKSTINGESLGQKEAEISALKGEISLLQDSICKINSILLESNSTDETIGKDTADYRLYIVKRGDCFRRISRKQLGTEQRFEEIATMNNMAGDAIIHPGDTLKIPVK